MEVHRPALILPAPLGPQPELIHPRHQRLGLEVVQSVHDALLASGVLGAAKHVDGAAAEEGVLDEPRNRSLPGEPLGIVEVASALRPSDHGRPLAEQGRRRDVTPRRLLPHPAEMAVAIPVETENVGGGCHEAPRDLSSGSTSAP